MTPPTVSIVVTTRNEERHIESCLRSIHRQTYPREELEVIVVDNASTDGTKEAASGLGARVFERGPERSAQRNFGISMAAGRYVLYLDADMILSDEVVAECVRACEAEGCAAAYIPERVIGEGFWTRVRAFERSFYDGTCVDAVRFVERDRAMGAGGFDEALNGPEDWDFDRRMGEAGRRCIVRAPLYHDEGRFSLRRYLRKKAYYAPGVERYVRKWGRDDPVLKKQLGFGYRYAGVFLEDGKWRRVLAHPVLAGALLFLRAAVGASYLAGRLRRKRGRSKDGGSGTGGGRE